MLTGELCHIAVYVLDNVVMVRQLCEDAIALLARLQAGGEKTPADLAPQGVLQGRGPGLPADGEGHAGVSRIGEGRGRAAFPAFARQVHEDIVQ
jgi:hypothetical protein